MKVGIIGAGTMGSGIAQTFAQTDGYEVMLSDINIDLAEAGKARIAKGLARLVDRGRMEQDKADAIVENITPCLNKDLGDCDLIVEAALEVMDVKLQPGPSLIVYPEGLVYQKLAPEDAGLSSGSI